MGVVEMGIAAMVFLCALMAILFVKFASKIIDNIEWLGTIPSLIQKIDETIEKVNDFVTKFEISKINQENEIIRIKDRLDNLERQMRE